jgi:hypothetical protein
MVLSFSFVVLASYRARLLTGASDTSFAGYMPSHMNRHNKFNV